MTAICDMALVLHGSILLLLSQVAGFAYFRVIRAQCPPEPAAGMWRMSHAATSAGALLLIALGPVVPQLLLSPATRTLLVAAMIVSSYALGLGTVLAAASGHRGTRPGLPWANLSVYVLYVVGALVSTLGALLLCFAAARTYLVH